MESFNDDEFKLTFLEEAQELLSNIEQCFLNLEKSPNDLENLNLIFRFAHNLKGSSGAVGFTDLAEFMHKLESLLVELKEQRLPVSASIVDLLLRCNDYLLNVVEKLRSDLHASYQNPELLAEVIRYLENGVSAECENLKVTLENTRAATQQYYEEISIQSTPNRTVESKDESIRVSLSRINDLINNAGELVIYQAVLQQQSLAPGVVIPPLMTSTLSAMRKIIQDTRDLTMSLRMLPVRQVFQKMQRIVRDASRMVGKDIQLHLSGEDTEVDKTVLERINDPLVHLVRNAVDHGLEDSETRKSLGKSPTGHIYLSASHRAGHVVIEVRDDGRGLNPEVLIEKAKSKGLISENAQLSPEQAYQLIFMPGFSTKSEVSDLSGRGVGMDVVKTNIMQLQGHIDIETSLNQGTCFRIFLPLTLAIIDGMLVQVAHERYVVPLSQVSEFFRPKNSEINRANDHDEILTLRDETLPTLRLEQVLHGVSSPRRATEMTALIIRDSARKAFALLVDDVIGQQQIVIKPLGAELKGRTGLMGSAILGDGRPALILDLLELVRRNVFQNKLTQTMESA